MNGKIPKYAAALGFCLLLSGLYAASHGFAQAALAEKYRILCDACTLPGLLLILAAALAWTVGKGSLDALGFLCRRREEGYGDFVARRRAEKPRDLRFLYVVGGLFLALSLVFLALYYATG